MYEFYSTLSSGTAASEISISSAIIAILVTIVLGLVISLIYMITARRSGTYSQSYALTLVLVPAVVSIIILMIGNQIAWAFGLAGIFSIIRFRSAAADPKDIAYLLFGAAAGLACGAGYYLFAAIFTLLLSALLLILSYTNFGAGKSQEQLLKITIPEDLNYGHAFDDLLEKYTEQYKLQKVQTTDLGSLYELVYQITLPEQTDRKEFMDELRCRNGNLNISLVLAAKPSF